MSDVWLLILSLGAATLAIRVVGAELGHRLPQRGPIADGLRALPGCLVIALVASILARGGPAEWLGAAAAGAVAILTKNLPATMAVGMAAVWALRQTL